MWDESGKPRAFGGNAAPLFVIIIPLSADRQAEDHSKGSQLENDMSGENSPKQQPSAVTGLPPTLHSLRKMTDWTECGKRQRKARFALQKPIQGPLLCAPLLMAKDTCVPRMNTLYPSLAAASFF